MWLGPSRISAQLPAPSFYHLSRDYELYSAYFRLPFEDPFGFIWFGSATGGGLYRYDGYDLVCFNVDQNHKSETIATDLIYSIYLAPDSNLYAGTLLGFSKINLITRELKSYNTIYDSLPTPDAGVTQAFLLDSLHHTLWIGTRYGLMSMDIPTEKMTFLRPTELVDQRMPDEIFRIYSDSIQSNLLWLFSYKTGIFTYDIENKKYAHIKVPGTPDDVIRYAVREKNSSAIWLVTNAKPITRFHPSTKTWKNYPVNFPGEQVYWNGMLQLSEDECWVASDSLVGHVDFHSGQLDTWHYRKENPDGLLYHGWYSDLLNDRHGRLWITSFQGVQYAKEAYVPKSASIEDLRVRIVNVDIVPLFEKTRKPLLYTETLKLRKDQRDISLQYVLPNPMVKDHVKYQYKLVGYDNDWIQTDQRRVRYSKLRGGNYTFMVTGKEGDAQEWLPVTTLQIHVDKRISEWWWFWVVLVGLGLTAAYLFYRFMILRAKKQERMKSEFEHKLSEIQMQALRAQMNPHFLFNSLNSIKYYAISKSKDETAAYLSKFALLVRTILNNSKSHTISLKDELDALQLYIEIEHMRLEGKFDYMMDIDKSIHVRQAQIPPMILQPYVENAIWHGLMHKDSKGRLLVQVKDMGNQIQCIIEDNGVGRERAAEINKTRIGKKDSVGMQITGNRIEIINRIYGIHTQVQIIDLKDDDGFGAGTRVVINIPLIRDEEE